MLSYPRKSAQRYELITKFTINELTNFHKHPPKPHFRKFSIFLKKVEEKICRFKNYAYLCNPKTNKAVVVKW